MLTLRRPGFTLDWGRNIGPILFWLNLESKTEADQLFAAWMAAGANVLAEPEDKPWKLREFTAADLDGNLIRVFDDLHGDVESQDEIP